MGISVENLTQKLIIQDLEARKFPSPSIAELSILLGTYQTGYHALSYVNPKDNSLVGWGIFVPQACDLIEFDALPRWYGLSVFGSESKVDYGLYQRENGDIMKRARAVKTGVLASGAAEFLQLLTPAMILTHRCQVHLSPLADYIEDQSMKLPGWDRFVLIDRQRGIKDYVLQRSRDNRVLRIGLRPILPVSSPEIPQLSEVGTLSETLFMYFYNDKEIGGIENLRLITQEIVQIVTPFDERS